MESATRSQLRHSIPGESGRRTKPIVSLDYIIGLTDGEGCFFVNLRPARSMTSRSWVETHFFIKVRIEDQPMLEAVKIRLVAVASTIKKRLALITRRVAGMEYVTEKIFAKQYSHCLPSIRFRV